MKTSVLRYGLFGSITICILFLISWFAFQDASMTVQEILGYASMVISLSFVYFGIKHFRDKVNHGKLTFGKGMAIGALISLITALAFGILDVIYVKFINPDFMTEYYETLLAQLKTTLSPEEFEVKKAEMEAEKALFANPFMNFLFMFITVFIIGFIITLISSLILQRKN